MLELLLPRNSQEDLISNIKGTTPEHIISYKKLGKADIPFVKPNIHPAREIEEIEQFIKNSKNPGLGCCDILSMGLCSATVLGLCFVCKNTELVNNNQYGFVLNSGKVVFLRPGWHYLGYPFMGDAVKFNISSPYMNIGNVLIIRIAQDEIGFGVDNANLELLLPGTHCRTNGTYVLKNRYKLDQDIIEGPIKIFTVRTGNVRVCYNNGTAIILNEGRYAVNSNGFILGQNIEITQQNLKFKQHKVLLDGGINMIVEGLLTYQIIDVKRLINNLDITKLDLYLEQIIKADLTKIFSTIHLEQISSITKDEPRKLGEETPESETRSLIYDTIIKMIQPQANQWGVQIINFQLESILLADFEYSQDYELTSLQIAKSKAELKAQEAQNILIKKKAETDSLIAQLQAEMNKKIQLIKADTQAQSTLIQANANATSIIEIGKAKAQAADMMKSAFGQELYLLNGKTKISEGLKMQTLVLGGSN